MEHIDLRKLNRGELKQVRRQVVRLKKMGKTGKEIEKLTGVRQNRASEIWTAYQREGDETGIDNCSNCERGFAPKGQPPVLPVETKRERLNMLSTLSGQGDIRFMLYEDSMNQQRLIQFMDRLVRTSDRKVFLILDNLKVHHGKKATAWLDRHWDRIELFLLPPYAPESNPDEYLNHALKLSVHSGGLPRTKCDIRHKTASFMRTLQHSADKVPAFFHHNQISYILIREYYLDVP